MRIKEALFVKSSSKFEECPPPELPEFAFIGRFQRRQVIAYQHAYRKEGPCQNLFKTRKNPTHQPLPHQWPMVPGGFARLRLVKSEQGDKSELGPDDRKLPVATQKPLLCVHTRGWPP